MAELRIDDRPVRVSQGTTVLEAARRLGIEIPTLCYLPEFPHHTSCMVCLVEDLEAGALVPACVTPARPGQRIQTRGARVAAARRRSLELLLSEHAGDCEAPCTRACPAHPDLPALFRRVARGDLPGAREVMLERLPLAGTLAAICPAPCERACRRGRLDSPVTVRALRQAVLEARSRWGIPTTPGRPAEPGSGKSVAVVGAGPAGMAAAYFLAVRGHHCTILDGHESVGGSFHRLVTEGRLSDAVLAADLGELERLGVSWRTGGVVDPRALSALRESHEAVILAPGSPERLGELAPGVRFERATTAGSTPGIFACGNATRARPSSLAVQAVADGRRAALAASAFLAGLAISPEPRPFDSHLESPHRVLSRPELAAMAAERRATDPAAPAGSAEEARRCLQCDCLQKRTCRLRSLSGRYEARPGRFAPEEGDGGDAALPQRVTGLGNLSYDPGKCIKCGICVRIAERAAARPGLAFAGRGYDLQLKVPFGQDLGEALGDAAGECVRRCPTGALVRLPSLSPIEPAEGVEVR